MFIEPYMRVLGPTRELRYPDLVICNSRHVIGIVELKYQPKSLPSWRKDIATFHWLAEHQSNIAITNSRFRGAEADDRVYPLSSNVLFVWAGVHSPSPIQLHEHISPELAPMFLALHAETQASKAPRLR